MSQPKKRQALKEWKMTTSVTLVLLLLSILIPEKIIFIIIPVRILFTISLFIWGFVGLRWASAGKD